MLTLNDQLHTTSLSLRAVSTETLHSPALATAAYPVLPVMPQKPASTLSIQSEHLNNIKG